MKQNKGKYRIFRNATAMLLLISFTLVSFGKDIHDCICHLEKNSSVKQQFCCKKEVEKSCCSKDNNKKECGKESGECGICVIESSDISRANVNTESKNFNSEIKFTKTDIKITNSDNFIIGRNPSNNFTSFHRKFITNSVLRI